MNLPEQISPYTFTKELIVQLPSPEKRQRLSHTKNEASPSTAPALAPLFMKQRRRTRNQCRGKGRCYTNQRAASASLQRAGKTVTLGDSDSPQLSTATWYSPGCEAACFVGRWLPPCCTSHTCLSAHNQLQVQGRFAQARCIRSRGTSSLLLREPPPLSGTVLKIKLGAEHKPGFCMLRVQGSSVSLNPQE